MVSVVTVARNAGKDLVRTIKSVIRQTHPGVEYIIVDGGSTDGTVDVIKAFEGKVDYWVSEADGGVYDGMNKALSLVRGYWVNFMNAGDWFARSDTVETVFRRCPPGLDVDCIYGDFYFLFHNCRLIPVRAKPLDDLWKGMVFSHQSLFVKRTVLEKYMFSRRYEIASDYHLIFRLLKDKRRFHHVDEFVSVYADGGLSVEKQVKSLTECWRIARTFAGNRRFRVDRYYIPVIYERIKEKKANPLQSDGCGESPVFSDPWLLSPFLVDPSFCNGKLFRGDGYIKDAVVRALWARIGSPFFKCVDVPFRGRIVKAGAVTAVGTDTAGGSVTVLTDFIETGEETLNTRIECFVGGDSPSGIRGVHVRCYDGTYKNVEILRFRIGEDGEVTELDSRLAHAFFHGPVDDGWRKVGGYVFGSGVDLNKITDFLKGECSGEIVAQLPSGVRYLRVIFVNGDSNGNQGTAWFFSPVLIRFEIHGALRHLK